MTSARGKCINSRTIICRTDTPENGLKLITTVFATHLRITTDMEISFMRSKNGYIYYTTSKSGEQWAILI